MTYNRNNPTIWKDDKSYAKVDNTTFEVYRFKLPDGSGDYWYELNLKDFHNKIFFSIEEFMGEVKGYFYFQKLIQEMCCE